jgi:multiple sugar transport system permease protein
MAPVSITVKSLASWRVPDSLTPGVASNSSATPYATLQHPATAKNAALDAAAFRLRARLRRDFIGYAFLAPWLIGFFVFTLGPVIASLWLSFNKFDLLSPPRWIGFDNYIRMFTADARFWQALKVTFSYMIMEVPLKLAFALAVALLLDRAIRGGGLYRALFYIPSLLGGSVAIAVLWRQLFEGNGTINQVLLTLFNYKGPSWISNPDTAIYTLVLLAVWQFGSPMIIFLAGLRQVPADLYEAAAMDGAGKWRQFRKITLPLLAPVIFFNLVLQTIEGFKAFTPAYVISGGTGGPIDSTLFYTLYLYQEAFSYFRMGYASALAWILLLVIGLFTGITFLTSKYWVYYEDEPR